MRKTHFLFSCILLTVIIIPQITFAHTISQHLKELYDETYLPVFIIAKLLPFIGLGMLSFSSGKSLIPLSNHWMLLTGIFLGIILAFIRENLSLFFIANNFEIILLGLLLLIISKPNRLTIQLLLIIAGISLGYEYNLNISHAKEIGWLFVGLLIAGLSIFILLSRVHFFEKGTKNTVRISIGFILVIAGLIVILLT